MNNYGPRMLINAASGMLCCWLWVSLVATADNPVRWSGPAVLTALLAWGIGLTYLASYGFPALRSGLNLPAGLTATTIVAVAGVLAVGLGHGADQVRLVCHRSFIPATLLAGPLLISSLSNHVWLSSWFREVFRFGDGDNGAWSIRSNYNGREMTLPRGIDGQLGWTDRILLGATTFRHDIVSRLVAIVTCVHLYTVGMSGSGKSSTAQWPAYAIYSGAGLIVDMKGEHAIVTGRRRSELGPVYRFDPLGVTGLPSSQCNVLVGIDETTDDGLRQIKEIGKALVLPENDTAAGTHFVDNACTIFEGATTFVCHTHPLETRNLVTVSRLINSQDPVTGVYDPSIWLDTIVAMSECKLGLCAQAAKLMDDAGDREGGSFLTTLSKSIKWMAGSGMQHFLSGNENPLLQLPTHEARKPTIYVVVGIGNEIDYSRYIRLMVAMGIYYVRRSYRETGRKPSPSVLIGLDEYPLYAKGLDAISTGFGTLREAGCMLWVCAQKNSQVKAAIGDGLKLLLQNSTVQVFGVNNDDDDMAAWVSDQLGQHVVRKKRGFGIFAKTVSEKRVPLMTRRAVQDALRQHSPNQIVFPADGGPPMWLHRLAYKKFKINGKQVFKALDLGDVFDEPKGVR